MKRPNKLAAILFLLIPVKIFCQEFSHTAELESVPKTGFYSIPVTPELSQHLNTTLSDLRIIDSKGTQVAYIIKNSLKPWQMAYEVRITKNNLTDSGHTILVLENDRHKLTDGVGLHIRNTNAIRTANISGSDDGINWYSITENVTLSGQAISSAKDRQYIKVNIPNSLYRFLKFDINNGRNDPIKIEHADFTYESEQLRPEIQPNPICNYIVIDSTDGNTYVKIIQAFPYHVNMLGIEVKSPKFFSRRMEVKGMNVNSDLIVDIYNHTSIALPFFNNKEFTVKIYNGDNPPLSITGVKTLQNKREVIVYLEKNEQYKLLMGNKDVSSPSYDLEQFKDSIPGKISTLNVKLIQPNSKKLIGKTSSANNTNLWLIIIGVLGILSFFTWNLTKELKKRNQ